MPAEIAPHSSAPRTTLHVAVVNGVRTIHFVAAAACRDELEARLGSYVAESARVQLTESDARRVRQLLDAGDVGGAVHLYFGTGRRRWDQEWLSIHTVPIDPPTGELCG